MSPWRRSASSAACQKNDASSAYRSLFSAVSAFSTSLSKCVVSTGTALEGPPAALGGALTAMCGAPALRNEPAEGVAISSSGRQASTSSLYRFQSWSAFGIFKTEVPKKKGRGIFKIGKKFASEWNDVSLLALA